MVGRKSKIDTYNLSALIDKLRAKGKSYREIAEDINLEYSEVNLTVNDISRHLRGYTKATRETLNLELMEYISLLQTELLCEMDRCDINSGDKKALKRRINHVWSRLEGRLKRAYGLDIATENSLDELGNLLIREFSNAICPKCNQEVAQILHSQGIVGSYHSD